MLDLMKIARTEADGGDLVELLVALGAAAQGGEVFEDALRPRARRVRAEELQVALLPQ